MWVSWSKLTTTVLEKKELFQVSVDRSIFIVIKRPRYQKVYPRSEIFLSYFWRVPIHPYTQLVKSWFVRSFQERSFCKSKCFQPPVEAPMITIFGARSSYSIRSFPKKFWCHAAPHSWIKNWSFLADWPKSDTRVRIGVCRRAKVILITKPFHIDASSAVIPCSYHNESERLFSLKDSLTESRFRGYH